MAWIEFVCPKCQQRIVLGKDNTYKVCDKCRQAHCKAETGLCKTCGTNRGGYLKEIKNN